MSRPPQDCFYFNFSFLFSSRPQKHFLLSFAKEKTKNKKPDKQGRNVQMLPTSAPRPVLNCEGSGRVLGLKKEKEKKDQDCGAGSVKPSVSQLELGLLQSAAKAIYFTAFHHFSNKKRKKKMKYTVKSCFIPFF